MANGKDSPEVMKAAMTLGQAYVQGMMFFMTLKPENDSHYVGGGVKIWTPDRPIFSYKPTGAAKYRAIHADLSTKDLTDEEVGRLRAEIKGG